MNSLTPTLRAAVDASTADDSPTAMRLLTQAVSEDPSSALAHYLMGVELASSGAMPEAESALAMALILDGSLAMARYQLGLLQFTDGRVAIALQTWEPLLLLQATDPLPQLVRGFGLLASDQFVEARTLFLAALDLSENRPLQSDIRRILERIDHAVATSNCAPVGVAMHSSPESEEKFEDSDFNHVLLSNYQSQGQVH